MRDILKYGVSDHMGARVDLEELAMKALKYSMAEGFTHADLNKQVCAFLSVHCQGFAKCPQNLAIGMLSSTQNGFHAGCVTCREGNGLGVAHGSWLMPRHPLLGGWMCSIRKAVLVCRTATM